MWRRMLVMELVRCEGEVGINTAMRSNPPTLSHAQFTGANVKRTQGANNLVFLTY